MPHDVLDACRAVYDENTSVVSFYGISRQRFLLIYEVCRDKQVRSQYELRFLKKEVADLVEIPVLANNTSLMKADSTKQLTKKGLIKRRYTSPFIREFNIDMNTKKNIDSDDSILNGLCSLANKRSSSINGIKRKYYVVDEAQRKEKEKEREKLKRSKTNALKRRHVTVVSRKALKPMMKVAVSVSKKQIVKQRQEENVTVPKKQSTLNPFD